MAKKYACRLDCEKGTILGLGKEDFIFRVNLGDSVEFQIEGCSDFADPSTLLIIRENSGDEVEHSGYMKGGHWVCEVNFVVSGSMKLNLKIGDLISETDYIVVNPAITLGGRIVPLDSLCIQTVLSRSMGPINSWLEIFDDQFSLGYNFFHITPIQVLGGSQSLYCIKEPTNLSDSLFPGMNTSQKYAALGNIMEILDSKGIGCMIDIVLNHCAYNSEFVEEYPEATYNLVNCPYLKSAYQLDKALHEFTKAVIERKIHSLHNKNRIENEKDLSNIMHILKIEWLPQLKLHQYFQMDVNEVIRKFEENTEDEEIETKLIAELKSKGLEYFIKTYALIHEGEAPLSTEINTKLIWKACRILGHSKQNSIKEVRKALPVINSYLLSRFDKHFAEILTNIEGDIRYHKLERGKVEITADNPIVGRYFQELRNGHVVIHNGFIMSNNDVLRDFAGKEGWHYFRRNVVIWADNIKLRYGNCYDDAPALWEMMKEYVISMARCFKGIRLDNAHGTPLNVSMYVLKAAREVNPNLYVMAELFTSDSKLDAHFVKVLGINGLVREALNALDPKHFGALSYEYGNGETLSLGKLEESSMNSLSLFTDKNLERLKSGVTPAIYYDCTHDNPTPSQKRKAHDALPNAAIVAMSNCTIASTRGYDEFLPKQLSVITEKRTYLKYEPEICKNIVDLGGPIKLLITFSHDLSQKVGTIDVKGEWDGWTKFHQLIRTSENNFEVELSLPEELLGKELSFKFIIDKTNWVHDWKQPFKKFGSNINNVIRVTKTPQVRTGIFTTMRPARTILNHLHQLMSEEGYNEIYIHQCSNDVFMIIRQNPTTGSSYVMITRTSFWDDPNPVSQYGMKLPGIVEKMVFLGVLSFNNWGFIQDLHEINGLKGRLEVLTNLDHFGSISRDSIENIDVLNLQKIPQSFLCIFKTELHSQNSLEALNLIYEELKYDYKTIFSEASLESLNHLLWRCSSEELDVSGNKRNIYEVPQFKPFTYAGIGGLVIEFIKLINKNNLGHEICNNIRSGDWLIDYIHGRLSPYVPMSLINYIQNAVSHIKKFPRGIIPKHFFKFIITLFEAAQRYQIEELFQVIPVTKIDEYFYTAVSQFWGIVPSVKSSLYNASLSAGLPHFATGFMRCWGRDTFISLTGLLICTKRFSEAREAILAFASVIRHGLIPNLLDSGKNCRYNARDATWFFLNSIKNFVLMAPEGENILNEKVSIVFKSDIQEEHYRDHAEIFMTIADVIQKIMQEHATGIEFREWNAGSMIDAHMRDEGFNVKIRLDPKTGLIYGGNRWNCGTWMDKMGSSWKAKNAGIPATPRDGAAIEINALLYSTLNFLVNMRENSVFPYNGVILRDGSRFEYETWREILKINFDKLFFIPHNAERISGYYKDTIGCSIPSKDLQLRPNQCIALAVAPDLFDRDHAVLALETVRKELMPGLGTMQIGIMTLNSSDSSYRNFYENSNDSEDYNIAHGFSYHNGPEWVWPVGYFLQSVLIFTDNKKLVYKCLSQHLKTFENSPWMSLPELTNGYGKECPFSCMAQAWSIGPFIEVLQQINR